MSGEEGNIFLYKLFFLYLAGRDKSKVTTVEKYLKANRMYRNFNDASEDPVFTKVGVLFFFYF